MNAVPGADVSVRIAWPADAGAIADLQLDGWYADALAARLTEHGLARDDLVEAVRRGLAQPPEARDRCLVALAGARVVGYAYTGPATDPDCDPAVDGEITELVVGGAETGHGHGSRLLQACADTLAADRFTRALHWLPTTDDATRAFLESAGWAPDGATRELADELSGRPLRQVRLHTALA
ncbi:MAG: GNAT family N-acetyltransferase [Nocardioidaceae bacterium]|nr:GNAT family N-acetyltransferase [Nocardioidaceae bacterium]MCL2614352.1 GNAT family N-acetyltransferase [Nocardioidaceae bacterium]